MYKIVPYAKVSEKDHAIYIKSELYKNIVEITEPHFKTEFHELMKNGGCENVSSELTKCLHDEQLLLDYAELNKTLIEVQLIMNQALVLTVMPTEGCNFRCPYCYENHDPISMEPYIIEKIKKYIHEQAPRFKYVSVGWFGGEPTLFPEIVCDIASETQAVCTALNIRYKSFMTTNGYLLTEELFKKFYKLGITSYQITLDGWSHDKTRPLASGKGTLDIILKNLRNISMLPKNQYSFRIVIRHNVLSGDQDFSWYDYLSEMFGRDERFSVLVGAVGDWGGASVKELNLVTSSEADSLILKHIQYIKGLGMQCEDERQGLFSKICYASYPNSLVFRANGKIGKCTVALDDPQNIIGVVDRKEGVVVNEKANALWWQSNLKPECYQCKDVLHCFNMQCRKKNLIDHLPCSGCPSVSGAENFD